MSAETTTAQPAVSTLPPPPPPPPPPRRPAPPDFGFQINGSFFFPRLDSTLTYQSASSPLQPPSCTFETSIFRSRHPLLFHSLSLSLSLSLIPLIPPSMVVSILPLCRMHRAPVHFAILNARSSRASQPFTRPRWPARFDGVRFEIPRIMFKRVWSLVLPEMIYHCRQLLWINDATALSRD